MTREYQCPNCGATNRVIPKCGKCQTEIADPALVRAAWWLHNNRKDQRLLYVALAALIAAGSVFYVWAPFSPHTLDECKEEAARSAKSREAMYQLIQICVRRFPNR